MPTSGLHVKNQIAWLAVMDLLCLFTAGIVALIIRWGPDTQDAAGYIINHLEGWLIFFGSILLANYLAGSYRIQFTYSRFNLVVTWLFSLLFAVLILSMISYAWLSWMIGRGVLLLSIGIYSLLSLTLKLLVYRRLFRSDILLCRTVILGEGVNAARLVPTLESDLVLPVHRVIALIRLTDMPPETTGANAPDRDLCARLPVVEATARTLESVVRRLDASLVVLGFEDKTGAGQLYPALKHLRFEGREVLSPLQVAEIYSGKTPLRLLNEEAIMLASLESRFPMVIRVKRLTDILVSLLASLLLLPVIAAVALIVKISAPRSPVFYLQTRVGHFGRPFRIIKFRTMIDGAERMTGPVWATEGDKRITPVGRTLRKFRLDELPQLFNVFNGDMSLVGPRPERPELAENLQHRIPFFAERENVLPGLTGWAQIRYPYGSTVEDAERKLEYDLYYMKHLSLSFDLQIILSTLRIVFFGKERQV